MLSICTYVMSRVTHSEPGLPMIFIWWSYEPLQKREISIYVYNVYCLMWFSYSILTCYHHTSVKWVCFENTVESWFFEPLWETKIGSKIRGKITLFNQGGKTAFGSSYLEVRKIESSRHQDSNVRGIFGSFQNVDELLLGLASMGFEFEDCQLALEAGNDTLESAVEWYKYVLCTVISQPIIEP